LLLGATALKQPTAFVSSDLPGTQQRQQQLEGLPTCHTGSGSGALAALAGTRCVHSSELSAYPCHLLPGKPATSPVLLQPSSILNDGEES